MAEPAFLNQSGASSSGIANTSHLPRGGEDADINGEQGMAPGGRWPQDDLPMSSAPGNASGFTEGFSPTADNPPLPTSHTEGVGLPPSGIRR